MSDLFGIGTAINGTLDFINGAWSNVLQGQANAHNYEMAYKNFELQKEAYDYQKRLNDLTMERQDNAFQRQVADLQKAGLSPLYANGNGSTSTALSSGAAPQFDTSIFANQSNSIIAQAQLRSQAIQRYADLLDKHLSRKQQKNIEAEQLAEVFRHNTETEKQTAEAQKKQAELINSNISKNNAETTAIQNQDKWNMEHGYRSESPLDRIFGHQMDNASDVIDDNDFFPSLIDGIKDGIESGAFSKENLEIYGVQIKKFLREESDLAVLQTSPRMISEKRKQRIYNASYSKSIRDKYTFDEFKKLPIRDLKNLVNKAHKDFQR